MKLYLLLAASMGLVACSTPPPVVDDATPFALVKRRFYTEAQTPVLDGIEDAVKGFAAFVDRLQRRETDQPPELRRPVIEERLSLVLWTAYFTDRNFGQLAQPSAALGRYCKARGGQWEVLELAPEDPLEGQRVNPVAAFVDAYARVTRHLEAQRAYVGFEEMRSVIAADVGQDMAATARYINRRDDWLFSVQGYRMGQRLGAFGLFECRQQEGGAWQASVLPVVLLGRSPQNQADPSAARVAIRVLGS